MNKRLFGFATLTFLVSFSFICSAWAADTKAIEQALRDLDAQWSAAAAAKDLDKTLSFYSDDVIVMPPTAPAVTTKEAVRKLWQGLFASPGMALNWRTTKVEVAKSGDMAYTTGAYEFTINDSTDQPVNDRGKYLAVWKKQADGKWKCGVDIWNSDLPPSAAAPVEKK